MRGHATDPYIVEADRKLEATRKKLRQLGQWLSPDQDATWMDVCKRYVVDQLRDPVFAILFEGLSVQAAERERWRKAEEECSTAWRLGDIARDTE